jgi:Protein of unknown function (DUF1759)
MGEASTFAAAQKVANQMTEAKIKVIRQQRGIQKRAMTVLEKYLSKYDDEDKLDSVVDGELKLEDLKKIKEKYENNHTSIADYMVQLEKTDAELEDHEKEFEHFEERYSAAATKLNKLLEKARKDSATQQPISANAPASAVQYIKSQTALKLPEIHLPNFDGQLVNYQSFKETFKALVHKDVRLGAVQKLFYLKGCLKNISLFAEISSLELTEDNYDLAWELLVNRYENRKTLVNQHIKAIFNLSKVDRNSASSLRQLIDNVSKHIHCLKSQKIEISDAVLIYIVTSKIDSLTHQLWEAHDSLTNVDAVATFESLKLFISNRARALENVEEFDQRTAGVKPKWQVGSPAVGHRQAMNTTSNRKVLAALELDSKCEYCQDKGHRIYNCARFLSLTIQKKLGIVKEKDLCQKCLKSHQGNICSTLFNCRVCGSATHNSVLHQEK